MLLLHPAATLSWTDFTVHGSTAIGITAFGAAYFLRARRGPSSSDRSPVSVSAASSASAAHTDMSAVRPGPTMGQRASFVGGLVILFLTLNWPLHDLSDYYLFSAHMVQHLILTLVVPPMLLLGTPGWMLRPLIRRPALFGIARRLTTVASCFLAFNVVLTLWHLPPMYNLALANHNVHIVQHLMFIAASVLMWWPLTSMLPELPRAAYPAQMLYLFLLVLPMSVIAICIAMADTLLYPLYAQAPRVFGISPMMDQQYGGLIMWIPGGVFFYAIMTVVFFKWSGRGKDDAASAQVDWVRGPSQEMAP
ncbi:MAG: cytochrome c oxidase assembly protein [Gemmatimonas sp.]